MSLKIAPFLILALGVAVIGYGLWRRAQDPPRVVSTGVFTFKDRHGTVLMFPKRVVAVAGFETTEVQLPGGTWIDCRGDCAETIKAEHTEFWETQQKIRGR
ncbi:MAG: hypothetical protein ABL901_16305 [Hyphomicrobiaceae bacterium]